MNDWREKLTVAIATCVATLAITSVAGVVRTAPTIELRLKLVEKQVSEIHDFLIPQPKRSSTHGEEAK